MKQGLFITLEGIEGVGKSTNLAFVKKVLESYGEKVVLTREPGGTTLGETVRKLLLDQRNSDMCDEAELLLMFAARAQHVKQFILPTLKTGTCVLCDRFTDATYAYQGAGRGLDLSAIKFLEQFVQNTLRPDLTLLLDVSVKTGLKRATAENDADRFEQEQAEFFEKIRLGYLARAEADPSRFRVFDTELTLDQVQEDIERILLQYLSNKDSETA